MRDKLLVIQEYIGVFLLILMSGLVFLQVVSRYVLEIPFPWIEELARLSMIWLTYILLSATFARDIHVKIDFIDEYLSNKMKEILRCITNILGLIFSLVTLRFIFYYFETQLQFGQSTNVMNIPMYIVLLPLIVGIVLTLIYFILEIYTSIKKIKSKRLGESQ